MALRADLPEAVALNGELLRDEGRPTEAIEAFMQAIELGMETSGCSTSTLSWPWRT